MGMFFTSDVKNSAVFDQYLAIFNTLQNKTCTYGSYYGELMLSEMVC